MLKVVVDVVKDVEKTVTGDGVTVTVDVSVAGVTVKAKNDEQSCRRCLLVAAPLNVPVTARAQLSALQAARRRTSAGAPTMCRPESSLASKVDPTTCRSPATSTVGQTKEIKVEINLMVSSR